MKPKVTKILFLQDEPDPWDILDLLKFDGEIAHNAKAAEDNEALWEKTASDLFNSAFLANGILQVSYNSHNIAQNFIEDQNFISI